VLQYGSWKNDRQHSCQSQQLLVDLWMQDKTTTQVLNKSFKYTGNFKHLRTILTNQHMHGKISGSKHVYYHSVQNHPCTHLLYWLSLKIKIYRTIIIPAVLCGCETWSITLREEHRLRILENGEPRKMHGSKREKVTKELHDAHYTPGEFYVIHTIRASSYIPYFNQPNELIKIQ
jgi:hypothetical protein